MPNVSFYIIGDQSKRTTHQLVCQLCAKATQTSPVQLLLAENMLPTFDELLWSYDNTSFLTHGINDSTSQINLSTELDNNFSGIVINQKNTAILAHHAKRIIELIGADESSKVAGRARYKTYREAGYPLETFHV